MVLQFAVHVVSASPWFYIAVHVVSASPWFEHHYRRRPRVVVVHTPAGPFFFETYDSDDDDLMFDPGGFSRGPSR